MEYAEVTIEENHKSQVHNILSFLCNDFTSGSANFSDTKAKPFWALSSPTRVSCDRNPTGFLELNASIFLRGSRCNHYWTDLSHLKHKRKREIKYWFSSVESCDKIISYPISFIEVIGSREREGKCHLFRST